MDKHLGEKYKDITDYLYSVGYEENTDTYLKLKT